MKLLYAIDIRDSALWHLDDVANWAQRLRATVDLMYVNPFGDYTAYVLDPALAKALDTGVAKANERDIAQVRAALDTLPEAVRGKPIVVGGDAATEIASHGADYDAVIVCTRGAQGLKRIWLGNIAERVLRLHHGTTIVIPANPA